MRFTFAQYLFPSFLLRQPSDPVDGGGPRTKKSARDEVIQANGMGSFTYLCCKGCHLPCTPRILLPVANQVTNSAIISKGFAGRYGRGYLCHDVINVDLGRVQERNLLTGIPADMASELM